MAALASQAGHLVAYQLRFGSAAQSVQSSGAHGYFPALVKSGIGIAALALIAALLVVGAARVSSGRRLEIESAPSYLRLLAGLFTLQLALYSAQETVEAQIGGSSFSSASDLLLWGALGQLPVAAAAAVALRWLLARLRPALEAIAVGLASTKQPQALVLVQVSGGVRTREFVPAPGVVATPVSRRGPPSFVR